MDSYLKVLPKNLALKMLKFRCRNTRFPVVLEGYENLQLANVKCQLCDKGSICDEIHLLLECDFFENERRLYLGNRKFTCVNTMAFSNVVQNCIPTKMLKIDSIYTYLEISNSLSAN